MSETDYCWPAHPRGRDVIAFIDCQLLVRDLDHDGMPRHPAPPGFRYEWEFSAEDAWLMLLPEDPGSRSVDG